MKVYQLHSNGKDVIFRNFKTKSKAQDYKNWLLRLTKKNIQIWLARNIKKRSLNWDKTLKQIKGLEIKELKIKELETNSETYDFYYDNP